MDDDESEFYNQFESIQKRVRSSLLFRLHEEIQLRDDEIERLKDRLQNYTLSTKFGDIDEQSDQDSDIKLFHKLQSDLFEADTDKKMRIIKMKTAHAQRMKDLDEIHNRKIEKLQKMRSKAMKTKDPTELDRFLQSVEQMKIDMSGRYDDIPIPDDYYYEDEEQDKSYPEMSAEIEANRKRVENLQFLIGKAKENPSFLSQTSDEIDDLSSEELLSVTPQVEEDEPNEEVAAVVRNFIDETEKYKIEVEKQVVGIKRKIQIEKNKIKQKKTDLKRLKNQRNNTDLEISRLLTVGRKIKKTNAKRQKRYHQSIEYMESMTEEEKEKEKIRLEFDNINLRKEIGRLDYLIYGKSGKYSAWRKL